jgi:fasciclin domain-containing protein
MSTPSSSANVRVNAARVVKADLVASNGVIHAIDAVMLPKDGNRRQLVLEIGARCTFVQLKGRARGAFFLPPRRPLCHPIAIQAAFATGLRAVEAGRSDLRLTRS